ncbi:MAG: 4-phosphoerythronate dehydrogenase [Sedimentisphaerales bacterium]|nr:4-phosphoerythronate dehydrogenase [Sedimentisphaerales bacterium]
MLIIADENIPYVKEVFGELGTVCCVAGRKLTRAQLDKADVLLVRSVTKVNADLLAGTPVRFVGTATIGTDHIDQNYLCQQGIAFCSAAGSNANSVAEYVITALLALARQYHWRLTGKSLGIIGVGNIGSIVERYAQTLGMDVWPCDPPVEEQTGNDRFVSHVEALEADFVTLHVPLTKTEKWATYHLLDEKVFAGLRPETVIINTSRGAVVDNQALKMWLANKGMGPVVLDVWENEPEIDVQLLEQTALVTPHIAGYSLDGKINGTMCLYRALCRFMNIETNESVIPHPPVAQSTWVMKTDGMDEQNILTQAMLRIYDISRDDENLRKIKEMPTVERGPFFDQLRKSYPVRREAANYQVTLSPFEPKAANYLSALGFKVTPVKTNSK